MLTFDTNNPKGCGIVETDEQGVVQAFHEKVQNPPGNRANGAVYAFDSQFLEELNSLKPVVNDLSTQVVPRFVGRIATLHTRNQFHDIGTPDSLKKAQDLWHYASS